VFGTAQAGSSQYVSAVIEHGQGHETGTPDVRQGIGQGNTFYDHVGQCFRTRGGRYYRGADRRAHTR